MHFRVSKGRFFIVFIVLIAALAGMIMRLAYLQFFHPKDLSGTARQQYKLIQELPPFRGKILDRNRQELAIDLRLDSLGANARQVHNTRSLAEALAGVLSVEQVFIEQRLNRDKDFVWIERLLTKKQSEAIRNMKDSRLELRPEWRRIYPNEEAAAHVVGFTGLDHSGLEGAEYLYDQYLKGIPGWKSTLKDAKQRELVAKRTDFVPPVDGYDLRLSVDIIIQNISEKALKASCVKYNAIGGMLVVMDAMNGDVLALANYPPFNPNHPQESTTDERRNRAVTDIYEPGSVFKVFTAAGVLDEGVFDAQDVIYCEKGTYRTGGRILHDVHGYGNLTLMDVIAKSSNIGTAKLAEKLGKKKLYRYIRKFGFYEKTGIALPGEVRGILRKPSVWSATSISSIPMGQEVGVTAIQLATALSAIANGGLLVRPRIVMDIRDAQQGTIKSFEPEVKRRVIQEKTAEKMKQIMQRVVTDGTGKRARVEGAVVGGKTGTAQKLDANGAYSHEHFIGSFAGYVELEKGPVVIVVSVDDPSPRYYGGTVAAPVFKEIAEGLLEYSG